MLRLCLLSRPDRSQTVAQRVADQLRARYRRAEIVWGGPGPNAADASVVAQRIEATMRRCQVVLVIIGPDWMQARSPQGLPWQADPADAVALGLAAALRQKKLIVPLLVHGAQLPPEGELAPWLTPLLRRQAVALRDDPYFLTDLRTVYTQINTQLSWRPASVPLLATAIGIVLTFIGFIVFNDRSNAGPRFVLTIVFILLNLALTGAALIGAFVLAAQRRQPGWLVALSALSLIGALAIVGIVAQVADGSALLAWEQLAVLVIALLALFGRRREMV
jgi:hypothetical protein